jgi:hypothetical protein
MKTDAIAEENPICFVKVFWYSFGMWEKILSDLFRILFSIV